MRRRADLFTVSEASWENPYLSWKNVGARPTIGDDRVLASSKPQPGAHTRTRTKLDVLGTHTQRTSSRTNKGENSHIVGHTDDGHEPEGEGKLEKVFEIDLLAHRGFFLLCDAT